MYHALEESEKLITSESQEYQEPKLLIDLNKSKNLMLVQNVVFSISEKSETNISHILLNAKTQQPAQSF